MKGNAYTDKYKNKPEGGANIAVASIEAAERAISRIAKAKDYLTGGDKRNWFLELGKLGDEIGELQKYVTAPELGQWGHDVQMYYLNVSLINSKVILDDPKDPSVADELLGEFQKIRNFWQEVLKKSSDNIADESGQPELGGLI